MANAYFAKKIPYYVSSALSLFLQAQLLCPLWKILRRKSATVKFDRIELEIQEPIDLLVIKEVLISDVYGIRELKNPAVIVDVGAGIGETTVFAAVRHPQSQVIAFEPNPASYSRLQKNVEHNHLTNIQTFPCAVGLRESYDLNVDQGNIAGTVMAGASAGSISVKGAALKDYVLEPVALIKIDAEGAELEVLKSLAGSISFVENFVIEYHNDRAPNIDRHVTEFLQSNGFTCRQIPDPHNSEIGLIYAGRRTDSPAKS